MAFMPGRQTELQVQVSADGVSSFDRAMDRAARSVGVLKTAVGLAGVAVAGFAAGALVNATKAAADFEEAMVEVEKVTNAEVAAEMSGEIMDMARTIPLAQEELAGLVSDAARFGVRGTENLRSFSEAVAKMAIATDLSADEAGEAFARLAALTGTPVSEMENMGSAINELSNNFATSSSEIVDSMLRSSAVFTQMGVSTQETIGLSAALNEVSESSERAGTRLRSLGQELTDPNRVGKIAEALGLTAEKFKEMVKEDPTGTILMLAETMNEGGDTAETLNGVLTGISRQTLAALGQNIDGVREAIELSNSSYEEATSLQREFDAASDTFNARLRIMKNLINENAIEIGNVLLPHLIKLLEVVNRFLTAEDSLINGLTAQQKAWGLVGSVIGGVAAALFFLVGGPIALIAAAVGALAAAWVTNFGGIQEKTVAAAEVIQQVLTRVWDIVGDDILSFIETTRKLFMRYFNFVVNRFWIPLWNRIQEVLDGRLGPMLDSFELTWDHFMRVFRAGAEGLSKFWAEWGDEILMVAGFLFDVLIELVTFGVDAIVTSFEVVLALLRGDFKSAIDIAVKFWKRRLSSLLEFIIKWVSKVMEKLNIGGFQLNLNSIPGLAEGGIVTSPTLAMIGERGPEAVVPLDRMGNMGGSQEIIVVLKGDGEITNAMAREAEVVVSRNETRNTRRRVRKNNVS